MAIQRTPGEHGGVPRVKRRSCALTYCVPRAKRHSFALTHALPAPDGYFGS